MEKERVRKFKNRQKRLAKKISEQTGLELRNIKYKEYLPGAEVDIETKKIKFKKNVQICIQGAEIIPTGYREVFYRQKVSKHRVIIEFEFNRRIIKFDEKIINHILKTQYYVDKNKIYYSVNPNSI